MHTKPATLLAIGAALLAVALVAQAQQRLYRVVGPNGEVTYTDRPPPVPAAARANPPRVGVPAAVASLPAELAQPAARYPVVLHTSGSCGAPCDDGRSFLRERGIPFAERTVNTSRDSAELQRISGALSLPMLLVGRQPLIGFRPAEWAGYLDAAGYPTTSRLPATYSYAAPTPLTRPVEESRSVERPAGTTPLAEPLPGPGAGGIRF